MCQFANVILKGKWQQNSLLSIMLSVDSTSLPSILNPGPINTLPCHWIWDICIDHHPDIRDISIDINIWYYIDNINTYSAALYCFWNGLITAATSLFISGTKNPSRTDFSLLRVKKNLRCWKEENSDTFRSAWKKGEDGSKQPINSKNLCTLNLDSIFDH